MANYLRLACLLFLPVYSGVSRNISVNGTTELYNTENDWGKNALISIFSNKKTKQITIFDSERGKGTIQAMKNDPNTPIYLCAMTVKSPRAFTIQNSVFSGFYCQASEIQHFKFGNMEFFQNVSFRDYYFQKQRIIYQSYTFRQVIYHYALLTFELQEQSQTPKVNLLDLRFINITCHGGSIILSEKRSLKGTLEFISSIGINSVFVNISNSFQTVDLTLIYIGNRLVKSKLLNIRHSLDSKFDIQIISNKLQCLLDTIIEPQFEDLLQSSRKFLNFICESASCKVSIARFLLFQNKFAQCIQTNLVEFQKYELLKITNTTIVQNTFDLSSINIFYTLEANQLFLTTVFITRNFYYPISWTNKIISKLNSECSQDEHKQLSLCSFIKQLEMHFFTKIYQQSATHGTINIQSSSPCLIRAEESSMILIERVQILLQSNISFQLMDTNNFRNQLKLDCLKIAVIRFVVLFVQDNLLDITGYFHSILLSDLFIKSLQFSEKPIIIFKGQTLFALQPQLIMHSCRFYSLTKNNQQASTIANTCCINTLSQDEYINSILFINSPQSLVNIFQFSMNNITSSNHNCIYIEAKAISLQEITFRNLNIPSHDGIPLMSFYNNSIRIASTIYLSLQLAMVAIDNCFFLEQIAFNPISENFIYSNAYLGRLQIFTSSLNYISFVSLINITFYPSQDIVLVARTFIALETIDIIYIEHLNIPWLKANINKIFQIDQTSNFRLKYLFLHNWINSTSMSIINLTSGKSKVILLFILLKKIECEFSCQALFQLQFSQILLQNVKIFSVANCMLFRLIESQLALEQAQFYQIKQIKVNVTFNCDGLVLNASNSLISISRSSFVSIGGNQFGGAIRFNVDLAKLISHQSMRLKLGLSVIFMNCSAQDGGAIYHNSLTPQQEFLKPFWLNNEAIGGQHDNVFGKADSLKLIIYEDMQMRIQTIIKQDKYQPLQQIRPGAFLTLCYLQLQNNKHAFNSDQTINFRINKQEVHINEQQEFYEDHRCYSFHNSLLVNDTKIEAFLKYSIVDNNRLKNLLIILNIFFRHCRPGEYKGSMVCNECETNTFSTEIDSSSCQICPEQLLCVGTISDLAIDGNPKALASGYWRAEFSSKYFMECKPNKDACFEDYTANQTCKYGYIGPLCQSCDLKGYAYGHHFFRLKNSICQECQYEGQSVVKWLLLGAIVAISVQFQLYMTFQNNVQICQVHYNQTGLIPIGTSGLFITDTILKILLFHVLVIQLSTEITQEGYTQIGRVVSNWLTLSDQSSTFIFAYDCLVGLNFSNYSIAYIDIGLSCLYFFAMAILGLMFSMIKMGITLHYKKFVVIYSFWTCISIVFTKIIAASTCKQILTFYQIRADLTQPCYDVQYYYHILTLQLPILFIIIALLLYLKKVLTVAFQAGTSCTVRSTMQFGMLFQSYKSAYYSFEYWKLLIRVLLIAIVYLDDAFQQEFILMIIIIGVYHRLSSTIKPFTYYKTQYLDIIQSECILLQFQMKLLIANQENEAVQQVLDILVLCLNFLFFLVLLNDLQKALLIELDFENICAGLVSRYRVSLVKCPFKRKTIIRFTAWKQLAKITKSMIQQPKVQQEMITFHYYP